MSFRIYLPGVIMVIRGWLCLGGTCSTPRHDEKCTQNCGPEI